MRETHPATIARPLVATPIGGFVTVFCADIIDKHFLNPSSKFWHSNLADVVHKVIVVIVRGSARKLMDMRIIVGSNTFRPRFQL